MFTNAVATFARAVALSVIVAVPSPAQEKPRGFIGLDIGPSQPLGTFKGATGNARAGYTSTLVNVGWRRVRFPLRP